MPAATPLVEPRGRGRTSGVTWSLEAPGYGPLGPLTPERTMPPCFTSVSRAAGHEARDGSQGHRVERGGDTRGHEAASGLRHEGPVFSGLSHGKWRAWNSALWRPETECCARARGSNSALSRCDPHPLVPPTVRPRTSMSTSPTKTTLNPQQEAFAVAFARNGGKATDAAREAGYSERTARQQADRLKRLPHVQQRIAQECSALMAEHVPQALAVQRQLMASSRSDMVKSLVAADVLDRVLGKATTMIDQRISGELTVRIDLT